MHIVKIIEGPLTGQSFSIRKNLKIGRQQGDIILKDSVVSDLHAEIKLDSSGRVMLLDRNSKNGIFVGEQKKIKVVLTQGLQFRIGKNTFKVFVIKSPEEVWISLLKKGAKRMADSSSEWPLVPFPHPVKLQFVSGPQKGESLRMTYGPCVFGKNRVDFPLLDQTAPEEGFSLSTPENKKAFGNQSVLFQTQNKAVTLNGKFVPQAVLKSGDLIAFGETKVEVHCVDH